MTDLPTRSASNGRTIGCRVALVAIVLILLPVVTIVGLLLRGSARPYALAQGVPDAILFPTHVALGTVGELVGASPMTVALEWTKAASHAQTSAEVELAARGIAAARGRAPNDRLLEATLCAVDRRGSPRVKQAIESVGLRCAPDQTWRDHVPDGTVIAYPTRPPTYGPHYNAWYPNYGVIQEPVLPGLWVHNLERGAIVLLYQCPGGCPELIAQMRALYRTLPAGRNSHGAARLIAIPYDDMDHQLAVVAWGDLIEMDQLDPAIIRGFYDANVDMGPECAEFGCPE